MNDHWIVCIGDLYLGGIGASFINSACTGFVLTKIRDHAQKFNSLDSAQKIAKSLGGQVFKV